MKKNSRYFYEIAVITLLVFLGAYGGINLASAQISNSNLSSAVFSVNGSNVSDALPNIDNIVPDDPTGAQFQWTPSCLAAIEQFAGAAEVPDTSPLVTCVWDIKCKVMGKTTTVYASRQTESQKKCADRCKKYRDGYKNKPQCKVTCDYEKKPEPKAPPTPKKPKKATVVLGEVCEYTESY